MTLCVDPQRDRNPPARCLQDRPETKSLLAGAKGMMRLGYGLCLCGVWICGLDLSAAEPVFKSGVITAQTPGHAVPVKVDIRRAKKLFLVVTDGGDGYGADWADWAEPRLVGPGRELKLTERAWKSARSGWGQVRKNRNAVGRPLRIAGQDVAYGIGTHANSVIAFDLPQGYTTFQARGGLDNGGTDQGPQLKSSVRFLVYLDQIPPGVAADDRPAPSGRPASEATASLDVAPGLEATLFASEPMLLSPTNLDVDHRGRVWVCEVVNYRHRNGARKAGDRILILEDTDGDGRADKRTVFYQGRDIDTALGICVLGNKVIVSVAPNVFVFTDVDGDGRADKKEYLFTKVGQPQHDHSTHAFTFGPEGKLYWNFGNTGRAVHDKQGKPIVDRDGHPVVDNGRPFFGGMPFRCNLDGSDFEVLAHNFRNNYEVAVDSFGTVWQSDNDDDGNRGVRINYVMEHGNYGYRDEVTGAGWRTARTGMHQEIPLRHWHLRDPGVVPNLLQTGQGSPTGICVYEGRLLPKVFWDQVVHCDAGPNVVRAYPVTRQGAGYAARMVNILKGERDKWFRPSDVCVAPDGSLIVADWYDPGVGGHRMGDIDRGRIFRVAPPKTPYRIPEVDTGTPAGAVAALRSPNLASRYLGWTALNAMGARAIPVLEAMYADPNPRMRARALWLLGKIEGQSAQRIQAALKDENPDIRITGLRLARHLQRDVIPSVAVLVRDARSDVRRECALALRNNESQRMPALWAQLAQQHDGRDRWYLEALGIGAAGQWDRCLAAWLAAVGDKWRTAAGRDILWRSRATSTPTYLVRILQDSQTPSAELTRYLRAFDFLDGESKDAALLQLAVVTLPDADRQNLVSREVLQRVKNLDTSQPRYRKTLDRVLAAQRGTTEFIKLVDKFNDTLHYGDVLQIAQQHPEGQLGVEAIRMLLAKDQQPLIRQGLVNSKPAVAEATARVLGQAADPRASRLLRPLLDDASRSDDLRRAAVRGAAVAPDVARMLLERASTGRLDPKLKDAVAAALHASNIKAVQQSARKLFPLPPSKNNQPLPPIRQLVKKRGDVAKGRLVFQTVGTCAKCHVVNKQGKQVGPDLSGIGSKLSRQAFFESVIFPSAGISHNYENHVLLLANGTTVNGIIVSREKGKVSLKGADAIVRTFNTSDIDEMVKQSVSLMPGDLHKLLSVDDLVNVVEYMTTLRQQQP